MDVNRRPEPAWWAEARELAKRMTSREIGKALGKTHRAVLYAIASPERREEMKKAHRARYHRDPEKQRRANAKWRSKNPDRNRENTRRWREENPERARAYARNWQRANAKRRALYAKLKACGISPEVIKAALARLNEASAP